MNINKLCKCLLAWGDKLLLSNLYDSLGNETLLLYMNDLRETAKYEINTTIYIKGSTRRKHSN